MDHFKSDFLKVLKIFIILFSFTSGENQAFENCKYGMDIYFGSQRPLLACIKRAMTEYKNQIMSFKNETYMGDVNEYYWRMHTLVSAEGIDLKEQFCKRLYEPKIRASLDDFSVRKPNAMVCESVLQHFESFLISDIYPTDSWEIRVSKLKKRVLHNALYVHKIDFKRNLFDVHYPGTYGAVYMYDIVDKLKLINGKDYTPLQFCEEKYKNDKGNKYYEEKEMRTVMKNQNPYDEKDNAGPSNWG